MPLHDIEMSGLPYLALVTPIAMTKPTHAASSVFTATRPMRRSVAPSVEPGLKPIHPNTSTSVPITTNGMLWPGNRVRRPVLVELPDARPEHHRERERRPASGRVDDPGSGEVDRAVPEVHARRAELREPAAAPHPHAVDRVDDRAHRDLGEEEAGERDPLGDRADDDVAGRLHEHDLEQEQHHHADVVGAAGSAGRSRAAPMRPALP